MPCDQQLLVKRLAVENPASLHLPPWRDHLQSCATCRAEQYAYERSLAVFRQFESQPLPESLSGPGWEQLSIALARSKRARPSPRHWRIPIAAASVLVIATASVVLWTRTAGIDPQPAQVVHLKPEHRVHLQRVLRESLTEPPRQIVVHESRSSHPQPAAPAQPPASFVTSAATHPAGTARQPSPEVGTAPLGPIIVVRSERGPAQRGVKAPVLLFRSLQQRRQFGSQAIRRRRGAVTLMPVSAPVMTDPAMMSQAELLPRPIR